MDRWYTPCSTQETFKNLFLSVIADLPPLPDDSSEGPTAMSPGSPCSVSGATAANDLRFHQLHGTNAVITNGGRTALRQNCRSEFNDAIVISNRLLLF